jgi:hypothetical protein
LFSDSKLWIELLCHLRKGCYFLLGSPAWQNTNTW